jgi:hypothetical protein
MRKLGLYLLAENRRAAIAALICALLPLAMIPTGFAAAVLVGLITLRKGWKAGLMVLAFAILPAICFLIVDRTQFFYGYDVLVAQCIIIWLLAAVMTRTRSWRLVLEISTLLGIVGVMLVHIFIPNVAQMWVDLYQQYLQNLHWSGPFHGFGLTTADMAQYGAPIATGAVALVGFLGVFLQLLLARWWETAIYYPGALKTEFGRIRIDRIAAGILLVASIGLYWKSAWLIDIYPVLLLPFMVGGLSIMHKITTRKKQLLALIVIIYLGLVIVPFFMVLLLALIGFVDSWFAFRKRLAWLK